MSHCTTSDHGVKKNVSTQTDVSTHTEATQLFDALNERVIAFKPVYARICQSVNAALLLSQLFYLAKYFNYREFYKTNDELCQEIGQGVMGIDAFKAAKKKLIELKFITTVSRGVPAKTYYTLNIQTVIDAIIASGTQPPKISQRPSRRIIHQLDGGKSTDLPVENPPTITKKTTEITTKKEHIYVEQARPVTNEMILAVFRYWQKVMNHPGARLDDKRKAFIARALKLYPIETCLIAIDGCAKTPHNIGDNDTGAIYDAISIIFKGADNIDRFVRNAAKPPVRRPKSANWAKEKAAVNAKGFKRAGEGWNRLVGGNQNKDIGNE